MFGFLPHTWKAAALYHNITAYTRDSHINEASVVVECYNQSFRGLLHAHRLQKSLQASEVPESEQRLPAMSQAECAETPLEAAKSTLYGPLA
jgi:hypothetical protein